jgi:ribosomal protein L11 methyltransferase
MDTTNGNLKPPSSWTLLTVQISRAAEEAVSSLLFELGTTGIVTLSEAPDTVDLGAYFPLRSTAEITSLVEAELLRTGMAADLRGISGSVIPDQDWMQKWKEGFDATEAGQRLIVVPSWKLAELLDKNASVNGEFSDDDSKSIPRFVRNRLVIEIDPGMAFGTGTHETTRLCLESIEKYWQGKHMLDIGTGTGILSIAAALLAPDASVTAIDVDPLAVQVALENVEINRVQRAVEVSGTDLRQIESGRFDLVVANLTADTICGLMSEIVRCIRPGGKCVLSGILIEFYSGVERSAWQAGLEILDRSEAGEWCALIAQKIS